MINMRINKTWAIFALVAAVGVAGFWLVQTTRGGEPVTPHAPDAEASPWSLPGIGKPFDRTSAAPMPARSAEEVRALLFKKGTLQGTEAAGEWCVTASHQLQPCQGLRSRFEYYLLGLGQVSIDDIRLLIKDDARHLHGDKLADEIMALFDKYWKIRTYEWTNHFTQSDRGSWMPVFEEQKSVRRQILGRPWAEAFFGEDEKHFQASFAQLESGQPVAADPGEPVPQMAPGKDPAAVRAERVTRYGEEAADRLSKVDAEWAEWDRRVNAARAELSRLQASTNLSEKQRKDEMSNYIAANFQGTELIRIKGLVPF